ncbi:MAG: hypothetical protein HGB36_01165 [Chlorobiaceae bacterium]|nr:hypothetical protein [Chlorobiaceae bacterium]
MWNSVLVQRALPLTISYLLLILAAITLDAILHIAHMAWIGRYLGVPGTLFFILSFGYSARKKKMIKNGPLGIFLRLHCNAGWIGTLMILIHSGIHFNALLPWAATAFMLIVTGSGHIGQYLLKKVKAEVKMKQQSTGAAVNEDDLEQQRYWDTMTVETLEKWRAVHMPLVAVLLALTMLHILSIAYFLNWS